MATHPAQLGCTCEWDGDDHYHKMVKSNPDCPMHTPEVLKKNKEALERAIINGQKRRERRALAEADGFMKYAESVDL